MAYSQEVYNKALEILERRREKATFLAEKKADEIEEKLPEIQEIQRKLSMVGLSIAKVFLNSDDKQADMQRLMDESLKLQEEKAQLLEKNGYEPDALEVHYSCSACNDTGYVKNRRCNCLVQLLKEVEKDSLRTIAPLDDCTFESFDVRYYPEAENDEGISPRFKAERILVSCEKYATGFSMDSSNLLFMGSTGLGKTHLSLAIANVVINKGYSVIYGTAQNILSDLNNENFGRNDDLRYNEKAILNCDLLILDDLGTEFKSNYTVACLFNIINTRLSAKRPTIISTNFTFEELEDKYDQRVTSRITGEYKPLVLFGSDIRYLK